MKVLTVIGARPQFVKAAVVSLEFKGRATIEEIVVHTGQHFDHNMSGVFFEQLGMPRPDHMLDINGGGHGDMTGRMLIALEQVITSERPDVVMVYGDTNSTFAGALAAAKLHIPVAHVEAGLRSFNMRMPEEINRILTDRISSILFCPTRAAMRNLAAEGITQDLAQSLIVGDVMQDSAMIFGAHASLPAKAVADGPFVLATIHRAENTDDPNRLSAIVDALNTVDAEVAPLVLPLHPRTAAAIRKHNLKLGFEPISPVGYLEMLGLLKRCSLVVTDSGGVQKEAFFFGKPCVTMRDETEWIELVEEGANVLAGAEQQQIIEAVRDNIGRTITDRNELYGGGKAASRIVDALQDSGAV